VSHTVVRPLVLIGLVFLAASIGHGQTAALKFEKKIGVSWPLDKFGWMNFVSFSPDGSMVASDGPATVDDLSGKLTLWSFPDGRLIKRLSGRPAAMSPDWRFYATGRRVVNMDTGRALISLPEHANARFSFSPDSRYVAEADRGVRLFELPSGRQVGSFGKRPRFGLAISPDGSTLAMGHWDIVTLWNTATGDRLAVLRGFGRYVGGLSFSKDGELLATGTDAGGLQIWDVKRLAMLVALDFGGQFVSDPQFSPDGRLVAVGVYGTGTVFLIDVASGKVVDHQKVSDLGCGSVAFSPDGRYLITPSTGGLITRPYDRGGTIRVFRVIEH
jgi:WD40 repeat protein